MDDLKKIQDFFELRDRISKYSSVRISIRDELIVQKDNLLLIVKHLLDALDEKEKTIKEMKQIIEKTRWILKNMSSEVSPHYSNGNIKYVKSSVLCDLEKFLGIEII